MYNIGDYIVYKRDVCIIKDIHDGIYNLVPLNDKSLKITIKSDSVLLRDVLSKENALKIINEFKNVEVLDLTDKQIENKYKELMKTNDIKDLIPILKSSYQRNKIRVDENKKVSDKDKHYFETSEELLYTELSIALNKSKEEVKDLIISTL